MVPMDNGGFLSVSWPLAVLTEQETSLNISFRSSMAKRLVSLLSASLRKSGSDKSKTDWLTVEASDVEVAEVGRRSIIFKTSYGDIRFAVMSHDNVELIRLVLNRLEIRQKATLSTIPSLFGMRTRERSK
jgi:hypothetical protein